MVAATLVLLLGQADLATRAQEMASAFVKDSAIAGVSVSVVRDGKVVLNACAGYAGNDGKRKVTPETLIRLGSISKPITAVGALELVDQGKLSLDRPVCTVVPEWPKDKPPFTLRQLLTHTSGVRHYKGGLDPTGAQFKTYSTADALGLFSKDPLAFQPGESQAYSTHAFTVVARAIEVASKTTFVDYMRKNVFGSPRSELDCEVASDVKPERSDLYVTNGAKVTRYERREDNSWKYGGGGMEATARGLALWADRIRGGALLSDKIRREMWTKAVLKTENKQSYGLGWRVDGEVVSHGGAQQGCRTQLTVDRQRKLTIAVLTNTSGNHNPARLAEAIAGLFAKEQTSVK